MASTDVVVEGNLVTVEDPKFLSLVGKPANKVSFRVVRSLDGKSPAGESSMKPPVIRRAKRSEPNPIVRVSFPKEYTDEQVTAQLTTFGLTGYNVARSDSGVVATRADLNLSATTDTVAIKLTADGVLAEVTRAETAPPNPGERVSVAKIILRADKFDGFKADEWLKAAGIPSDQIQPGEGDFVVQRQDIPEGTETRTVEVQPGVSFVVVRADADDIPDGYAAVVNEACYGNWGWGHLDFDAAMADSMFTELMDDAVYRLRSVLDNILLYSALPLAERKTLVTRALEQFNAFAASILDSLPRTVLVAVARSATPPKENPMTTKNEGGASTPTAATQTGTTAGTLEASQDAPITRSELKTLFADMLKEAGVGVQRSEPAATGTEPNKAEVDPPPAAGTAVATESITRADVVAVLKETVPSLLAPVVERMERLEGATVVRSDTGDSAVVQPKKGDATKQDVFRGAPVFGGLGLQTVRQ